MTGLMGQESHYEVRLCWLSEQPLHLLTLPFQSYEDRFLKMQ